MNKEIKQLRLAYSQLKNTFENVINELMEESKKLLVPKSILMQTGFEQGDGLGIVFNAREQVLFHLNTGWAVLAHNDNYVQCELVKVNAEDRKVGYTYLMCGYAKLESHITALSCYCKYLGDGQYVYTDESKGITISDAYYPEWYEVRVLE